MSDQPSAKKNKWKKIAEEAEQEDHQATAEGDQQDAATDEEHLPSEKEHPHHESVSALENKVKALEMEIEQYKEVSIRAKAELENFRRRAERDVSNARKFGSEKLLLDLLPVIDSLMRGLEGATADDPHTQAMREGMQMTLDMLHKTIEKHGVVKIAPEKGEAFDPERHEAMTMQSDPDAKSNTILNVLQWGYELNGRVIRAAMVIVAQ